MKSISILGIGALIVASLPAFADSTPTPAKPPHWASSVEVGVVTDTGNTDQRSFKFRADTEHDGPRIKHTFHLDTFRQTQNAVVSADKLYSFYQGDYKLDDRNALFGRVSYENDRFSGYDYQTDVTFGYNRVMLLRSNMELDGAVGAGEHHAKQSDGVTDNEAIARFALKYSWQIGASAVFKQDVSVDTGANSTIARSNTSLETTVVGRLAMKLSYSVKHQSNVPAGFKQTDTESSVTLVYNF